MRFSKTLRRLDWPLLLAVILLIFIGQLILFAINFKDPSLAQDFSPLKQLINLVIGLGLLVLFTRIDWRILRRVGKYWYAVGVLLLVLVLVVGETTLGSKRALDVGLFQFQPSEFMKLGLIMALAGWFSVKGDRMNRWRNIAASLLVAGLPIALVAAQPDLGSAIVLVLVWLAMILVSRASKFKLATLVGVGLIFIPLIWVNLQAYQQDRIYSFLNPESDPHGAGYNALQATIAVGSGGVLGKGLGSGTQSQLNFLPSQHTDFVFAVTAEKLGFVGAILVVALFGVVIVRAFRIARRAKESFSTFLAAGVGAMLLIHMTINIGMNLGLLPVTGIPLPFLSYGGTSLIINLIAVGLLQSVRLHVSGLEFRT